MIWISLFLVIVNQNPKITKPYLGISIRLRWEIIKIIGGICFAFHRAGLRLEAKEIGERS